MESPASQVVYCRHGISCRAPATMLVQFASRAPQPSCERCARLTWEHHPDLTQMSPLGEYTDLFAEAKQAAFATPGQVIRGEPAALRQTWDTGEPVITPVAALAPARAGNGFTAEERAARTGRPAGTKLSKAAIRRRLWWILSLSSVSIVTGIVMLILVSVLNNSYITASDNWITNHGVGPVPAVPPVDALEGWGIFFILAPVIAAILFAAGWLIFGTISEAAKEARRYKAWKATLSPQQQRELWLAETAAMAAGAYAVHRHVKASRAEGAARFQGRSAAYQAEHAQRQQGQMAADLRSLASGGGQQYPGVPGPTRRSDIHGNLI